MTVHRIAAPPAARAHPRRFRLSRAGILNVWQYDDQVFEFADGRLLLRGANGAGKSKTLEMLLPFVLDGDKLRMTASGRHHTSLLWLMTDGYDGTSRVGYLWVEFVRITDEGGPEWLTCGIGIRASQSARTATTWYFTSPGRVGHDLPLEDSAGPLPRERCRAAVEEGGHYFESPRQYKQYIGEKLFGLSGARYDELLRLLYWLRQPQIGEDIEPGRLAEILSVALPELDGVVVRAAGGTLDELAEFGEQLARRRQAADAMSSFARLYAGYARGVAARRGSGLAEAHRELLRLDRDIARHTADLATLAERIGANEESQRAAAETVERARQREKDLEASPEARSHQQVIALGTRAGELAEQAENGRRYAGTARDQASVARQRADHDAAALRRDTGALAAAGQSAAAALAALGVHAAMTVPAALVNPRRPGAAAGAGTALADRAGSAAGAGFDAALAEHARSAADVDAALAEHARSAAAARPLIGEKRAAVRVVDAARRASEAAGAERRAAESQAARAEAAADAARGQRASAERVAGVAEDEFASALTAWQGREPDIAADLPAELTDETVRQVGPLARQAARPHLDRLAATAAEAGSGRVSAERELAELGERRRRIEAEPDPAPDPPPLGRGDRDRTAGAPLWRMVDFSFGLETGQRAALEAALESSGLLDAWVRVDGRVLDAGQRDVVLPAGPAAPGASLRDLLTVVLPDGCPVTAGTVAGVLRRIAVEPDPAADAVAGPDGYWRLGPLTGRAAKPAAQYIGATARAAERARRLAETDAAIAAAEEARRVASAAEETARQRRAAIEDWLTAAPDFGPLIAAWAELRTRTEAAARAGDDAGRAEEAARIARAEAVAARAEMERLGQLHDLPVTADGLAARDERLRELDDVLAGQVSSAGTLGERLRRHGEDLAAWARLDHQAAELEANARTLAADAAAAAARYEDLRRAVEASVAELEARLRETKAEIEAGLVREKALRAGHTQLAERHGSRKQALADTGDRRAGQESVVAAAAQQVAGLATVPGLLSSAGLPADGSYELARGVTAGVKVPDAVADLARSLAGLEVPERPVAEAAIWGRHTDVTSGPAADCEPRVLEHAGLLAVVARDETGERPLGELAASLTAEVARDAELLTERERRVFEEHILGDLGEALRSRRVEAEELVAAMNRLLADVTTSQGVRVSLRWKLREDVPGDTRQAVALLGRPLGALLPDERQALRDCLHRLIETSRSEQPELSYAEHLGRALDYRQWFAFRVSYTRPELDGRWLDLHRRSPLSQGEQKVVCYLPLFAAAAAHFTSVAGAAPHAPRFVLLDDAFPKIDIRTHPLLFGLLVDLDLDFVVTSERLWGDHETVPSLAIYEALRDPSERGIAQYQHRWDGQRLRAVGV